MKRRLIGLALIAIAISACGKNNESTDAPVADVKTNIPVTDIAAGQSVSAKCVGCHGADGASGKSGIPFLAGQQAEYLVAAMSAYASGKRPHDDMRTIIKTLTEQDIINVAAYYAQLPATWKGAAPPPTPHARTFNKDTVATGQASSRHCDSCHGVDGNSAKTGVPSLAGLQPEYFTKALTAYLNGERTDPVMAVFKESLDKGEIKTMAAYYASQVRLKTKVAATGNAANGKSKAATCSGCHGGDGNSINPAMPSLAGQDPGYLEKALLAYHGGQRKDGMMQPAVAKMSAKDLRDLAAFFAGQEPRKPGDLAAKPSGEFDPLGDGARIAANCEGCHGQKGNSTMPGIPSLSGLHNDYLEAAIKGYRDGPRKNALMKNFVLDMSNIDIAKVALYFSTQEPAHTKKSANGDVAAGEKLAATCNGCHGDKGNSTTPATPTLAGQDAIYIKAAITAYTIGARTHTDMQNAAKSLKDKDTANVAAYFAAQSAVKPDVRLPEAPAVLAQKCNRCHGDNGHSTDPTKPRLAGQSETYLVKALHAYKGGARPNSMMHAMSDVLSDMEIDAIAAYYARRP